MMLGATTGNGTLQGSANAVASQDVGGTAGDTFTDLSIHGSKASEQRQTIAGLSAATIIRFGESLSSSPSFTAMQEMSVDSSGADATLATGGVRMNYIPRDGGNTFKGLFFMSYANSSMQTSNYTTIADDPVTSLQARGLRTNPEPAQGSVRLQPGLRRSDHEGQVVVVRNGALDRGRELRREQLPEPELHPGVTPTTLLNNTTMTYAPDLSQDPHTILAAAASFREQTLRLAWQVRRRTRYRRYYNNKVRRHRSADTTTAWEALNDSYFYPFSDQLVQWSSPVTNRLLLEAGIWHHQETWGGSDLGVRPDRSAGGRRDRQPAGVADARLRAG